MKTENNDRMDGRVVFVNGLLLILAVWLLSWIVGVRFKGVDQRIKAIEQRLPPTQITGKE